MKPDVAKPQVAGPEVAQPEATEPEVAGPKVSEPEGAKPEVTQTENTKETVPEVLKPEVTQTENAIILKPDASKDELVRPNDVTTEEAKPEVPKPQFAKPEVSGLKSAKPEASKEETVESSSETAQSGVLHPETLQTEAPRAEIVPLKTLEEDVAKPETDQQSEVQSELLPPAAGQQQAVPKITATLIPATNVAVPAKTKDSASESTQNVVAGSAPQAVANQTLSAASTDGVTGMKNETTSGGSSGFDPFSAIRAIARPVINAVTTVRDTIRPVFGAALSPIVGPSSPGKGDGEGAQKSPNATQPPFQGTETPSDVPSKQPNGKGAENPEETTILPDKQNESLATTTSPLVPDKVAAEPKIAESNPSSSETVIPTGDVSKNASQSQSGLPGLPFDPTTTIKRLTQPAISVATAVRDRVKPVFDAAIAPVVDVISPGKESGVGNQTLEVQQQPKENKEGAPSFTEAPKEPVHSTEDNASSTKPSKEQEQSAEMSKLPKSTHEDTSNSTETPKEQGKRLYSNYKLFTTFVGNDTAALAAVSALQEIPEVDFWNIPTLNRNVTFLVPPGLVDKVTEDLTKAGLKLYVLTNDIQSWLDRERDENRPGVFFDQRDISNFAYDKYHRVEEITGYLDLLAQKYSNIATVRSIGMTQEGRPIKGIILSTGGNRPVIWLDGGIHAREWISPASLVYLLGKMTSGYGSDSTITGLMQAFDFYVFPVVNPDGYAYTFHADRLWRKNRSGGKQGCRGVDPNRNFAASFGGPGTSSHPCSDIYRGSAAFSETESRAIRDALVGLGSRTKAYVTVHSYSQLIMVPYGHGRGTYTKDYADQIAAARAISRAIQVKSGVYYQVGTISSLLGSAAGSSTDWVYDSANIKYSLAVELRDKGRFGFLLPNFLIVPTSDEFTEGVKALGKFIARRELNKTIQWIDRERSENHDDDDLGPRDSGSFRIDMYHTLDEIYGYLDAAAQKYPNLTSRITIGKTEDGLAIRGLKISSGGNSTRPAIWIDGGTHAREWISTASTLFLIDRFLNSYNDSSQVTKLIDTFDWYMFPVINADGYKYTWTTHRLWRKNRIRNVGSLCRGVDPNRNFDVHFGLSGSSANPCAENYAGIFPFSEAESRAIRDGINNVKDRLRIYINLHSFSQLVMIPYGYSKGYTSDYKDQYEALEKLVTSIRKKNSAYYRHGTAGQALYVTSGAALDWVYDKAKVKHSFVIELRDRGLFGFILPREFINPTGEELFSGVKAVAFHVMKKDL
ncbi:uncharacterized protein ISCGN_000476 [Ixodes scapularis]